MGRGERSNNLNLQDEEKQILSSLADSLWSYGNDSWIEIEPLQVSHTHTSGRHHHSSRDLAKNSVTVSVFKRGHEEISAYLTFFRAFTSESTVIS